MGHRHYWQVDAAGIAALSPWAVDAIAREVRDAYDAGIIQRAADDSSPPIVGPQQVVFAAPSRQGVATFAFDLREESGQCDTQMLACDQVVGVVLGIAQADLGDLLAVQTDGDAMTWRSIAERLRAYGVRLYVDLSGRVVANRDDV